MRSRHFRIAGTSYVAEPRRAATELAQALGYDASDAGKAALIATELATNIAQHAGEGEILLRDTGGAAPALEVLAIDKGPGIAQVARAMEDGYSTAGTLGHGLGTVARQADTFELFSQAPGGTVALARISPAGHRPAPAFSIAGVSVAQAGEIVCGDDWAVSWEHDRGLVLAVDGLGHGIGASEAALQAVHVFTSSSQTSPAALVEELHRGLRPTRGAALAVAGIDLGARTVRYAGLGNVGASIVTPERKRTNLASQNGTAGHAARRVIEFSYPFPAESILVMFTDGLMSGWDPSAYPRLWSCDPAIIAAVLYRDFSRRRDDVTVVVGTQRGVT